LISPAFGSPPATADTDKNNIMIAVGYKRMNLSPLKDNSRQLYLLMTGKPTSGQNQMTPEFARPDVGATDAPANGGACQMLTNRATICQNSGVGPRSKSSAGDRDKGRFLRRFPLTQDGCFVGQRGGMPSDRVVTFLHPPASEVRQHAAFSILA